MCTYYLLPLASSVTNVRRSGFSLPGNASKPYNVTFICTIHPDSIADQCVVMAMDDGRVTRMGK